MSITPPLAPNHESLPSEAPKQTSVELKSSDSPRGLSTAGLSVACSLDQKDESFDDAVFVIFEHIIDQWTQHGNLVIDKKSLRFKKFDEAYKVLKRSPIDWNFVFLSDRDSERLGGMKMFYKPTVDIKCRSEYTRGLHYFIDHGEALQFVNKQLDLRPWFNERLIDILGNFDQDSDLEVTVMSQSSINKGWHTVANVARESRDLNRIQVDDWITSSTSKDNETKHCNIQNENAVVVGEDSTVNDHHCDRNKKRLRHKYDINDGTLYLEEISLLTKARCENRIKSLEDIWAVLSESDMGWKRMKVLDRRSFIYTKNDHIISTRMVGECIENIDYFNDIRSLKLEFDSLIGGLDGVRVYNSIIEGIELRSLSIGQDRNQEDLSSWAGDLQRYAGKTLGDTDTSIIGAFINQKLVGYAALPEIHGAIALLGITAVHPSSRRQKVFTALYEAQEEHIRTCKQLVSTIQLHVHNEFLKPFYTRKGYLSLKEDKNIFSKSFFDGRSTRSSAEF